MKIIQKLRERPAGVDVVGLALGESAGSDVITVGFLYKRIHECMYVKIKTQHRKCNMNDGIC